MTNTKKHNLETKTMRALLTVLVLVSSFMALHPAEIHDAVRKGDLAGVQAMLAKDPGLLNAQDDHGRTPLLTAVALKQEGIFKFLLAAGADVKLADKDGFPPLFLACFFGLADWTEPLIRKGAEIDAHANFLGYSPLHAAARGGHNDCVEKLLANGARLDLRDAAGNTPLLLAAANGREEAVVRLLAKGASPHDRDGMGSTTLHLAALAGNEALVRALLEKGAAVHDKNRYGGSPLAIAAREGHDAVVKILLAAGAKMSPKDRPELKGEYLGQPKPGAAPALFAPGIVSTEKSELNSVFTPDGGEFYFTIQKTQGSWTIMVMKRENDSWSRPRTASFSGVHSDVDLFIAPDGKKLYFCSNRPRGEKAEAQKNYDIWVVERRGGGWSEPANLGAPVNSDQDEFYPALTRDGTIFFQSRRPEAGGGAQIFRSRLEGGVYRQAEKLGKAVNCEPFMGDTLVAPDESWVILSVRRPGGSGQGDLCVSFRNADDSWTEPQNLGREINTKANENCAILTPDGKYLFYTSAGDIYWVSAEVIEALRPRAAKMIINESGTAEKPSPVRALVLLGEWFGDAYFPLQKEMEARGWTQKRVGVDAEYRGCYKKKRDVVLTSDILIPDLQDLSAWDVLIVPSGPQFRKFKENPAVLEFLSKAHASGMLIASFCVGNFLVQAAGLIPEGAALFPEKVTKVKEGLLLGPRGGGPPPGDGFLSAPIMETCDAIERELHASAPPGNSPAGLNPGTWEKARQISQKSLVIDCHSHSLLRSLLPERKTGEQMTFALLKAAGIKGVVQALPIKKKPGATVSENVFSDMEFIRTRISRDSLKAGIALASSDLDLMGRKGETAILIALESFDGLGQGDLGLLQKYHDQGVRVIGLFQAGADRIYEADQLTELGRSYLKELNRLGMICDITHLPPAIQERIAAESLSPVIISHSAAFHLIPSDFNVPDSVLEKLASKGGILCLTFFSGQLASESLAQFKSGAAPDRIPRASVEEFINQIDYLKKKIGIDHIGIGSDYGGSGRLAPRGLETAEGFPLIIYHLLQRGYSESEIEKIMGANFAGFWRNVEEQATAAGDRSRKN
jgi:microsomal dipeptidase-like Zn-dependent dipeptidase/ankyrin repeat protein